MRTGSTRRSPSFCWNRVQPLLSPFLGPLFVFVVGVFVYLLFFFVVVRSSFHRAESLLRVEEFGHQEEIM